MYTYNNVSFIRQYQNTTLCDIHGKSCTIVTSYNQIRFTNGTKQFKNIATAKSKQFLSKTCTYMYTKVSITLHIVLILKLICLLVFLPATLTLLITFELCNIYCKVQTRSLRSNLQQLIIVTFGGIHVVVHTPLVLVLKTHRSMKVDNVVSFTLFSPTPLSMFQVLL